LKCSYLVDNGGIGHGLTFSSLDVMEGVTITVWDLSNHTYCAGPYQIGPLDEAGEATCIMKMVGRINKGDVEQDIRTMSNIVMVEASFREGMSYYNDAMGGQIFKAEAKEQVCEGVGFDDFGSFSARCVLRYAMAYGCKATQIGLGMYESCYKDITYDGCLDNGYMSCNQCPQTCSDALNTLRQDPMAKIEDPMWDMCQPTCNMSTVRGLVPPIDFCAPGCDRSSIADGRCDPECFNEACHLDGGDCSGAPYFSDSRIVSSFSGSDVFQMLDGDSNGHVDEREFGRLDPLGEGGDPMYEGLVGLIEEFGMEWTDRGFNMFEFSALTQFLSGRDLSMMFSDPSDFLARRDGHTMTSDFFRRDGHTRQMSMPEPNFFSIDDIMDSVEDLDEFAIERAVNLVRLYDSDLSGDLGEWEIGRVNPRASEEDYHVFLRGGLYEKDAHEIWKNPHIGSADKLANLLLGVYVSLSGRRLTEPAFDNKGATTALVALLDVNSDGMLSFSEISLAGISPAMARAIDSNMDSMIDEEEFLDAQMRMAESGCAGTTVISDRNEVIMTKPPLTGASPRNCTFYILPNWFYPRDLGSSMPVASPVMVMQRRSGSVHAKTSTASQKDQKNVHHMTRAHSAHAAAAAASRRSKRRDGHEAGTVHHDASPGEMGLPVELDKSGMDFVVQIFIADGFACMGALIRHDIVIVSGDCAAKIREYNAMNFNAMDNATMVTALDAYGATMFGMTFMVSPDAIVGENAFALITVYEAMAKDATPRMKPTPVELHDGGGLDLSDCREKMVAVGLAAGTLTPPGSTPEGTPIGSPQGDPSTNPPFTSPPPGGGGGSQEFYFQEGVNSFMAQQYIDVADKDRCSHQIGLLARVNSVLPRHACGVTFNGARKMCFSDGHLLLARHPENRTKWILVGIADANPSCDSPVAEHVPTLYNEIAPELPWILSAYKLGRFPPLMLAVEASDLEINDGDEVHVNSPTAYLELGNISSKCVHGGEYYDMGGDGSLSVLIRTPAERGQQDTHIKLSVHADSCGESGMHSMPDMDLGDGRGTGTPTGTLRRDGHGMSQCSPIDGCYVMPDGRCGSRSCTFMGDWKYVTQELQSRGKAFTGGLGGEAEVDGQVEFRQWMCARDWNVEEQLSCGLGPGEIGCFRFDEKSDSDSGFEWYGRNDDKKIVSERKRMDGVAKQRKGLTSI